MNRRRRWSPDAKRKAIALGREHGAAKASWETGIGQSTIRSWLSRGDDDAPAVDVEPSARPADAPDEVAALEARVARTHHAYDEAVAGGDALAASRLAKASQALQTSLTAARAAAVVDEDATAGRLADLLDQHLAEARFHDVQRYHFYGAPLREAIAERTAEIDRLAAQRSVLEAQLTRPSGSPSLFGGMTADEQTWPRPFRSGPYLPDADAVEPVPIAEPAPPVVVEVVPDLVPEPDPVPDVEPAPVEPIPEPVVVAVDAEPVRPLGSFEPNGHVEPDPEPVPTPRPRRRRYGSVQQELLARQGVNPNVWKPPTR